MSESPSHRPRGRIGTAIARLVRGWSADTGPTEHGGMFSRPADGPLLATTAKLPERPLVSVIMTSYDTAGHVAAAVESILRQSWEHLELVVVDDASRDDSLARLDVLKAGDDRLSVIALATNAGTYRAKNTGISAARGEVVTFMDSDDTSHPERIERQLELLQRPGVVATTCNYTRHSSSGEIVLNRGLRERRALISVMLKRQVIDDIGWFDSVRTSADDEFFERIRLVYGDGALGHVDRALYFALHREKSLSTSAGTNVELRASESPDAQSGLSAVRQAYVSSYRDWHQRLRAARLRPYMPQILSSDRPFAADPRLTR